MIDLQKFPKGKKLMAEFAKDGLQNWANEIAKKDGKPPKVVTDEEAKLGVEGLFLSNPRLIYDMFDLQDMYLIVILLDYDDPLKGWGYDVAVSDSVHHEEKSYKSRAEAELEGFNKCFEIYERRNSNKTTEVPES